MPGIESLSMVLTTGGIPINVGNAQDTMLCYITTKALDFGQADKVKFLDRIITHLRNAADQTNLSIEIYGADAEDGPFVLHKSVALANNDPQFLNDVPGNRYYKFKFIDLGVRERWMLHGFEIFGEYGGDEF